MTYFQNIQSLADLKKEYRRLAMLHHPDKGGDTALMQQVNTEFGKLFEVWKDKPCVSTAPTGYEHDFQGATAKEYTEYVYNEYRWKGRNYNGQSAPEITELVRAWLKETYPRYTFSVRKDGYSSILIRLMKADFEAFTRESGKVQGDINHYNIQASDSLTDRAKEVMTNVRDFVMSYNFDESDPMTDYFHTNFYLTLGIGSYRQPYRMELPKITGKDVRKPDADVHAVENLLQGIAPEYRTRIVIHDFFSLKDKYLLGGIHLNSRHPEAPANYEGILSRACHSLEEVETTVSLFNYVLMSPVYDSISKQGYRSGYSKVELKQAQESGVIHEKVVALGGISEVNLAEIKSLGFGGAALLGDIWNRYHTWKDAEELLAHFRRLKKIA